MVVRFMTPSGSHAVVATTPQDTVYRISPVQAGAIDRDPEFIRLPLPGARCRFTGLSRTTLVERLPEIKHVRLRKAGSKRSIVLIHLQSLREYLESHMIYPAAKAPLSRKGIRTSKKGQVVVR
jgi:hypothetical protein